MRRTKAEAAETRSSIIASAERVFYDKGIAETTLEDVARDAGVTRGAIYWHFANKTELLLALYDSAPMPHEDMILRELQANPDDPLSVLERTSASWLDEMSKDERRSRIYTILFRCDYSPEMAGILQKQREADASSCQFLLTAFKGAYEKGQLASSWTPDVAARSFLWLMKGVYTDWLRFGMQFDLATEGGACVKQLFSSFRRQ
ncbi:TetR family transcriptional regulator [Rhizobium sp. KVB221]|uniref:TetR family transcriptional regulator n=1 Tax=Rhizobium setariae TaxID=2801340 RepID=A0A936YLT4_9HYPH|nr:TetR family transcriptional regulator [Rhizobium setariae]MBL0372775.1 TetR family transcriptional regulator [Rhizobium setariae]